MLPEILNPILLVLFRIVALMIGAIFVYFGYRLFKIGYFEKAGEVEAVWGEKRLILKQTAPGIFFAMFGAIVIGIGVWKPISLPATEKLPDEVVQVLLKSLRNEQLSNDDKSVVVLWLSNRTGASASKDMP